MRRGRSLREYRQKVLQERAKAQSLASAAIVQKRKEKKEARLHKKTKDQPVVLQKTKYDYATIPACKDLAQFDFLKFSSYEPCHDRQSMVVCHVIESLGLGGAQTMMFELINGLNKYYGSNIINICVFLGRRNLEKSLYKSYGIESTMVKSSDFKSFCKKNNVDIVVQHRIAISKCIKSHIPAGTKYVLINHTWHNLSGMKDFVYCDAYVSVCDFLNKKTSHPEFIHRSRKFVILNGVENSYLSQVEKSNLEGTLKTGRCHRLPPSKFQADSLHWMKNHALRTIPGFTHYLIGNNRAAKVFSKKHNFMKYMGVITDRTEKMSIIKSLDVYFYETFQDEGASVAILEALAAGVPVLCKSLGGCPELVKNGVNGFIARDRTEFLIRFQQLNNTKFRQKIKEQVIQDFNERLHIKHTACKYMQLFEALISATANISNN